MLNTAKDFIRSTENLIGLNYRPKLGKDLIDIYRKVIKFIVDNTDNHISPKKVDTITKSLNDMYSKSISKIIKDNTGLDIDYKFTMDISTYMTIRKPYKLYSNADALLSFGIPSKNKIKYKEDYKKYDIDLGKFISSPIANDLGIMIRFSVYNFLLNYIANDVTNTTLILLPEEATAITLHELGHAFNIIIGMIYNGYTGITSSIRLEELRNNFQRTKDANTFLDNLKKDLKNNTYDLPEPINDYLITNIVKVMNNNTIISKFDFIFLLITGLLVHYIAFVVITKILLTTIKAKKLNYALYGNVYSRSYITNQNSYMNERWADEYVSKIGYADALATGLVKITQVYNNDYNKAIDNVMSNNIVALSSLSLNNKYFNTFGLYEAYEDRLKRLIQDNIAFLKSNNVSDETKRFILDQNYKIRNIINTIKKQNKSSTLSKILSFTWLESFFDSIFTKNKLSNTYEKILDDIDNLMSNPIYEVNYKLKQLIDKMS